MESNDTYNSEKDKEEKRRKSIINSVLSTCSPLDIYCSVENDLLGIWFDFNGKKYLAEPLELFNTIYEDKDYDDEDYELFSSYPYEKDDYITVEVHKDNYCYTWRLLNETQEKAVLLNFSFHEYINKIKKCFEELHAGWLSGKTLIYDKYDLSLDAIKVAIEQLKAVATLPSYDNPRILEPSDFEETFKFDVLNSKHIDNYIIGIGDRVFSTWITHWDNSFCKITDQLESLFFNDEPKIEISFDSFNTIIKIKRERCQWVQMNENKSVHHDFRHTSVEIIPNAFANMPIIKGYCDFKKTIKTFYEGLLHFALIHPFNIDKYRQYYYETQLEFYNTFKSPLIERMIVFNKLYLTEVTIKRVLRIKPDYHELISDSQKISVQVDEEGNTNELYDKHGNPIKIPELKKWQQELRSSLVASETEEGFEKDWQDFHNHQLVLYNN